MSMSGMSILNMLLRCLLYVAGILGIAIVIIMLLAVIIRLLEELF